MLLFVFLVAYPQHLSAVQLDLRLALGHVPEERPNCRQPVLLLLMLLPRLFSRYARKRPTRSALIRSTSQFTRIASGLLRDKAEEQEERNTVSCDRIRESRATPREAVP